MKRQIGLATFYWTLSGSMVLAANPPTATSKVGDTVKNVVTGQDVKITELVLDPADAPGDPALAFVKTDDGNVILVRNQVGNVIYNNDAPPLAFVVTAVDATAKTVTIRLQSDVNAPTAPLSYAPSLATFQASFQSSDTPGTVTPPVSTASASGVRVVSYGNGGSNGRDGALFVPPSSGGNGDAGPTVNYTNTTSVNASGTIGVEVGSVGGSGGSGGDSYASFWSGRDGGDGGAGGTVNFTNSAGTQVTTSGDNAYGIFVYSRSGAAGNGGGGFAAPGGGTGGHSSNGGNVNATNAGTVSTNGTGAVGFYGLSVSNNGGNGGGAWGLVGQSGSGGYGGSGGNVSLTNSSSGQIFTQGTFSHGMFGQSIGGTGGSSGASGNLILGLSGSSDNGGNGGNVTLNNQGLIQTTGNDSRGMFAQSIGGGGGSGGSSWGLVSLGGSGSNGGSSGAVSLTNGATGSIITTGLRSDGIFAQSVGGSGGSGSNAAGLVAVGGGGSKAGNGGTVSVTNLGTISTTGDFARGIVVQSIGGGGGDGGSSGGLVAVGGSGSGGGNSSTVSVTQGGSIITTGNDARGIMAQSIGGGGGNGGSSGSVGIFAGVAVGGAGAGGGTGGNVNLTMQGKNATEASSIHTKGDRSAGLYAQSIGGGGGSGGGALQVTAGFGGAASVAVGGQAGTGGAGGTVSMTAGTGQSIVHTEGNDSTGIFLQSVGGGGGDGGYALSVAASGGPVSGSVALSLGGDGGSGGAGGQVSVGSFSGTTLNAAGFKGSILTEGDRSTGLLAQSVGGGGGNGGMSVAAAGSGSLGLSGALGIAIGGSGAQGGNGGNVSVGTSGDITTGGDFSNGMLLQSIGGGGGNGGSSIAASLALSGGGSGAVSVGVGGSAGVGGIGGTVIGNTSGGKVTTTGDQSSAIVLQSIGGGGGNGGMSIAAGGAAAGVGSGAITVGVGGSGGTGGVGGSVHATVANNIETFGEHSNGLVVQSIGGGGGTSGLTVSAGAAGSGIGAGNVNIGVGGTGGNGGNADVVNASYTGSLITRGDASTGILAQSIGGGGGDSGGTIVAGLSGSGVGAGSVTVGVGGNGGGAGNGGRDDTATAVTLRTSGSISTYGDQSAGVVAQSIGGGGGNGGYNVSAGVAGAGVGAGAVSVGLGGKAGSGGNGKGLDVALESVILTEGDDSAGVILQSLGGGGGNGGFNVSATGSGVGVGSGAISIGLGGAGGTGGIGGAVRGSSTGTITTKGDRSWGFVAQSIGGGGGNGGFNVSAGASGAGVGSGAISVGLGGSGGTGGNGGSVVASTSAAISTLGDYSGGILAQSVGGGGGNGAFNVSATASGAGTGSGAVSVGLGGNGAGGGNGSTVNLTVNNNVTTKGEHSSAIIAQSIGGGGGNGGFDVSAAGSGAGVGSGGVSVSLGGKGGTGGTGGDVTATITGKLSTDGDYSSGLLAQSVGGGGGNGGFSVSAAASGAGTGSGVVSLGFGGSGGSGGAAGNVTSSQTGDVTTTGAFSSGVTAQSVGGGGGNGGMTVAGSFSAAGTGSGSVAVGLGGAGGGGGKSGTVGNTVVGDVTTGGSHSSGVLAQSIGGGGGNGGMNVSGAISLAGTGSGALGIGIGGSGGSGGESGAVTNSVTGDVITTGSNSNGVTAQSIGGGGGNGGMNVTGTLSAAGTGSGSVSVGLGGSGGSGGKSSTVNNTVVGDVTTSGVYSGGVLAQSLGGGGGNGGLNVSGTVSLSGSGAGAVGVGIGGSGGGGGNSAIVTNSVTGDVKTSGANAFGIAAQSIGGGGGNGGLNVTGGLAAAKAGTGSLGVGIGGAGGAGGDAADVTNTVSGYVQTNGKDAGGVLAQSLGGGGGNGGLNVTGTLSATKTASGTLAVGVGGLGGDGGDAANVTNTLTGGLLTLGDQSIGVLAQSLGGGGGNGGMNVSGAMNLSMQNGGSLGVGVGGFGGDGGKAGNVTSTITTSGAQNFIATTGNDSAAVVAQSIGGGGGNGGLNVTGAASITGKNGAAIGIGVGGFGGGAGDAGTVVLSMTGPVVTTGNNSTGVLAQSIGGGGGNGGTNVSGTLSIGSLSGGTGRNLSTSIGVGGFGGDGGNADDVRVTYQGVIDAQARTWVPESTDPDTGETIAAHYELRGGAGSHGLAAQSIGGGGGNGALNVSGGIAYAAKDGDAYGIVVGVGGYGGGGGTAGDVNVDVTGTGSAITSRGTGNSAILAQSIGGGGGNGGTNVSGGIVSDAPLIFGVGGSAADGGIAGDVTVNATATLVAAAASTGSESQSAAGVYAQSLGGGGGNGALNVSGALAISKEANTPSVTFGIGGHGGAGAISGDVNVNQTGSITSTGEWVHGVLAQSIAGGGGNGGMNVAGSLNFADSENSGSKTDIAITAGIGGNAGTGANAGNVSVTQNGIITTSGDHARGVIAQSIGGGGGNGGMNVTGVFAKKSSPISVGVGGSGDGGGNAGSVSVTRGSATASTDTITTNGVGAHGIEASSVGGGGGDAGMNFIAGISLAGSDNGSSAYTAQFAIGGSGADAGNGGAASVDNYSDILTQKDNSHGILAQSIGGGGGNGNFNLAVTYEGKNEKNMGFNLAVGGQTGDGGLASTVDVLQRGAIETEGSNAYGILAQSVGGGGGNAGMDLAFSKTDGGKMGISIGRQGGTGGIGDDVSIDFEGSILTHGDGAFGMLAQSIGNGGGNSSATSVTLVGPDTKENPANSLGVSVGLEGGTGGRSGDVTVDADGIIETEGDKAHAIFAQSVGGGGGNGALANTFGALSGPTVGLSLGGMGGSGGVSGIVRVNSTADLRTHGSQSVGILAQSVGGGGGTGGMALSGGSKSKVNAVTVAVGGDGGTGMASDDVFVTNSGVIIADGEGSHGVLAQSIGGGGGTSGMTVNVTSSADKDPKSRMAISVGGKGGTGAVAGDVTITNTGNVGTSSANSIGLFAQSIGGGGGIADSVYTTTASGEGGGNNLAVTIGGNGGTGAAAGNVTITNRRGTDTNSGKIITLKEYSHGIAAMSIGGGGGSGSNTYSIKRGTAATADTTVRSLAFNMGGFGGTGGTGGAVDVTNEGDITTYGFKAHGVLAQSIGGGGGNGGMALTGDLTLGKTSDDSEGSVSGGFTLGGFGGDGNKAGDVTVTNSGTIEVFADKAYGIYAQSVGGGGGDGGFAATLSRNILTNPKKDIGKSLMNIAVGGNGGDGGDSGNVVVNHSGAITAHGDNAYGIFAQAVGGGGGNVGYSLSSPVWTAADLVLSQGLGARDSDSGTAGTVTINTTGTITVTGDNSTAYLGQSINGGGGNVDLFLDVSQRAVALGDDGVELPDHGGDVDKTKAFIMKYVGIGAEYVENAIGSAVDATHIGDVYSSGKNTVSSLIQSIGGGGGNSNTDVVVNAEATIDLESVLGGSNSQNNAGGDITATHTGDTTAIGQNSQGLQVQSIGGGGGNFTYNLQSVPVPDEPGAIAQSLSLVEAIVPSSITAANTTQLTVGGNAATLSNGGLINLTNIGDILKSGDAGYGALLQSIGGGGGKATLTGISGLELSLGGSAGTSGDGGSITLANTGLIATEGTRAHGMILQSIGGGGGAVFTDLDAEQIALGFNTGNQGNGGDIEFTQAGDVHVSGLQSIGIIAQSLGGGGGLVDRIFADTSGGAGTSGSITLTLQGNVVALGDEGIGVLAQSRANDGQGDITVELAEDKLLYAGANGIGLQLSGGVNNLFDNKGTVITKDELQGMAVVGSNGSDVIDNQGIFYGQFALGTGANAFFNREEAQLVVGTQLELGAAENLLTNSGEFLPGDMQLAQRSSMTGSFTQDATGETFAELDFGSDILDGVDMTGTAKLAGDVKVSLLNPQVIKAGDFRKNLFSAVEGVENDGMSLTTAPSVVILYRLDYSVATEGALEYSVDFAAHGGVGRNLADTGKYINRIQNAGSSPELADTVVKLLYDPDMEAYAYSLSQLSPDFYGEQQAEFLRTSQSFGELMATGGQHLTYEKGKKIWFNYDNTDTTHSAYEDYKKVNHSMNRYAFGVDTLLAPQWTGGLGLGFADTNSSGYQGRWHADSDIVQLGAGVRGYFGATEIDAVLAYSWNRTDTERHGQVTGPFTARSNRDMEALTGMVRFSHVINNNQAYFKPILDFGMTRLMLDDAYETGGGPTGLVLHDENETHVWVKPAVQVGLFQEIDAKSKLRYFLEGGLQYYLTESDTDAVAGFAGAPSGVSPIETPTSLGTPAYFSLGVELITISGFTAGVNYTRQIDEQYGQDVWGARLSTSF